MFISQKLKLPTETQEKAEKISQKYNIPHVDYSNFDQELRNTDILIVATGAKHPIVNQSHFPNGKETLVIDLSIPHNVEKNVTENKNVTLIDVDELSKQIQETIQQREKEIPKAEKIIKELMKDFIEWEKKRKLAPNIHHFKAVLKNMERNEMHNFYKKNKYINITDMELSDKMIQKITNRFAKYIIDNPLKAEEISKLMHEILVEQPNNEFNEKH